MSAAFTSIMNKKIGEEGDTPTQTQDVTLVKYKKKARDIDEKIAKDDAETKKRFLKEQRRLMGRLIPTKAEAEHERTL